MQPATPTSDNRMDGSGPHPPVRLTVCLTWVRCSVALNQYPDGDAVTGHHRRELFTPEYARAVNQLSVQRRRV
jgi:hypothetical protein